MLAEGENRGTLTGPPQPQRLAHDGPVSAMKSVE
ncbi:MAG: hypothetical protein QOD51_1409, partial [Candidatus Eremiobacteraeota bacterium]|nr:hypothetical protein [Candidatus Eremiobacteraeota bacterium]